MNLSVKAQRLLPEQQGWTREKIGHVIASEETGLALGVLKPTQSDARLVLCV